MSVWCVVGHGVAAVGGLALGLVVNLGIGQVEAFNSGLGLKKDAGREGIVVCPNCSPTSIGARKDHDAEVLQLRTALKQARTKLDSGKHMVVDSDAALMLKGLVVEAHAIVEAAHPG
jgi:hypothetical protein